MRVYKITEDQHLKYMTYLAEVRRQYNLQHGDYLDGKLTKQSEAEYHERITALIHTFGEDFLTITGGNQNG